MNFLKMTSTNTLTSKCSIRASKDLSSGHTQFTTIARSERRGLGMTTWSSPEIGLLKFISGISSSLYLSATQPSQAPTMWRLQMRAEDNKFSTTLWTYFSSLTSFYDSSPLITMKNKKRFEFTGEFGLSI